MWLIGVSAASASNPYYKEQTTAARQAVVSSQLAAEKVLRDLPQEKWEIYQVEDYLNAALWNVYFAVAYYVNDNDMLPSGKDALTSGGYIENWPFNPETWEEMPFTTDGEFSPFSFTMLVCPPEYWSFKENPRPRSFELCVFGPNKEFAEFGNPEPAKNNEKWATAPEGTLFMLGAYYATKDFNSKK